MLVMGFGVDMDEGLAVGLGVTVVMALFAQVAGIVASSEYGYLQCKDASS